MRQISLRSERHTEEIIAGAADHCEGTGKPTAFAVAGAARAYITAPCYNTFSAFIAQRLTVGAGHIRRHAI